MSEPEESSNVHLNARNLRGIAHPVRVRILGLLRAEGAATATGLARRLELNTGATSYHLRQLAEHGFIAEDAERGTSRERWWKAAHLSTMFDSTELTGDSAEVGEGYLRSVAQLYSDRMAHAVDVVNTLPRDWRSSQSLSDFLLCLTPGELEQLNREVLDVVGRYRLGVAGSEPGPPGSARVWFQFQSFPDATDSRVHGDEQ